MVTAVYKEYDYLLKSPHLMKKDNPGVPTIQCSINRCSFNKTVNYTGSSVNIMAKVKGPNMARGGVNSLFKNSTNSLEQEVSK